MLLDVGLISRKPRICVAQAQAANPLYLSYLKNFEVVEPIAARKTLASAIQIGNPVSVEKAIYALKRYDGVVEQATEDELVEAAAAADRTGLFNCPHTGVALSATKKLVERGLIRKSDRVVVISTAHGLKFVDFKLGYHRMELEGIISDVPNPPIELPARYETVRDRMIEEIDRRFGS
jgi:threonine synthase